MERMDGAVGHFRIQRLERTVWMVLSLRLVGMERAVGNHWSERYIRSIGLERVDGAKRNKRMERTVGMVRALRMERLDRAVGHLGVLGLDGAIRNFGTIWMERLERPEWN
jgi:hypothetical protein